MRSINCRHRQWAFLYITDITCVCANNFIIPLGEHIHMLHSYILYILFFQN